VQRHRNFRGLWKRVAGYGAALAAGALALQWLDYDRLAWSRPGEIYIGLIAAAFLALGIFLGMRLFAPPRAAPSEGNPQAVASLGISPRELVVLKELADGRSNKEIARRLEVSPNTVKTHLARLYEKLGAERRTDAVRRARELGIIG
jgi:DNA-binding CsgD family transcriptional regulator